MEQPKSRLACTALLSAFRVIAVLNMLSVNVFSQPTIILPAYNKLPDGEVNRAYSINLTLSSGTADSWIATEDTDDDFSTSGLALNPNGLINGTPVVTSGGNTYNVVARATNAGISKTFTLTIWPQNSAPTCPSIREFVLLLDLSGSMRDKINGIEKWAILKENVKNYLPLLTTHLTANNWLNDWLTVIFFKGNNAVLVKGPEHFSPSGWMSNAGTIESTLFGTPPNPIDLTPIGDGLLDAIAQLNHGTTIKSIILFSDGMQTAAPWLQEPGFEVILTNPNPVDLNASPNDKIKIFTIGVGAATGYADMLRNLANPNQVYAQADVATSPELDVFFTKTIPAALQYCTPRILNYRNGTLKGAGTEVREGFTVNKFVDNLIIRVIPEKGVKLDTAWGIYRNNVKLTGIYPTWDGQSLIYHIDFPYRISIDSFLKEWGFWEVGLKGSAGGRYTVTAMTDDDYLRPHVGLGKPVSPGGTVGPNPADKDLDYNNVNVGDEIRVQAYLTHIGKPVTDAQFEVILLQPGEDLGDLAANTNIDMSGYNPPEPNTSLGQAKVNLLLQNAAFVNTLQQTSRMKPMLHIGNGMYAASFNGNTLTGTYRAVIRYKGSLPKGGDYEGWETQCILVEFGEPEDIKLEVSKLPVKDEIPGAYRVTFTPVNRFGKKLGPGYTHRIKVTIPFEEFITDNLDGSYTIQRKFYPKDNPQVEIYILDQQTPVYTGSLKNLGFKKWFLSAHAGTAFPVSKFDAATYKTGYFAEVDFGRMLSRMFYLEAVGGYYNFGSQKYIIGGSLYAGILPPIGANYKLNLGLGGGYYKPKNEDAEGGLSVRLGIRRSLNANLDACLDGAYFYLPKTERAFATVGLGVKYFF